MKDHINDIAVKLNRANTLLFKIRNFVNITISKTIYSTIFDFHINYANFGLRIRMLCVEFLHYKKGHENYWELWELLIYWFRLIDFKSRNCYSSPLFFKLKLLKFNDKILLENVLLISSLLPPIFNSWLFAPIFITMRQPHPPLVICLKLLSALIYMEKIQFE